MAHTITGLFDTRRQAEKAITELKAAGFDANNMGILAPNQATDNDGEPNEETMTDVAVYGAKGAVTGGAIGGTLGAILAATGALIIPGIGPFITGGILVSLVSGAAGWLVGGLVGMDIPKEEAAYYESQVQHGRTLVIVKTEDEMGARQILRNNDGQVDPGKTIAPTDLLQEHRTDIALDEGLPPTRPSSTPEGARVAPPAGAVPVNSSSGPQSPSWTNGSHAQAPLLPPIDTGQEATAANPVPLSPTDPHRRSNEGQPFLDDANPLGRNLLNRENRPLSGVGVLDNPAHPDRLLEHEQPGQSVVNSLPQALDPEPFRRTSDDPSSNIDPHQS